MFVIATISMELCAMNPTIKLLTGEELRSFLPFVAQQRINTFREFPYLYEGTIEYETDYLQTYQENEHAAIAVAYVDNKIAGFATGVALNTFDKAMAEAMKQAGLDPTRFYYIGEVIVTPSFRGNKIAEALFAALEQYGQSRGYAAGCFMTVVRADDDPQMPDNYRSLDRLWNRVGYKKSKITVNYEWPTIQANGSIKEKNNQLILWLKDFK